jgi:hypothetical protein
MATTKISAMRQVMNFLTSGKTLTAAQAKSRFGVKNFRAMISEVKYIVETNGNWEVNSNTNSRGDTVYSITDTHPGTRTYGYEKDGSRFLLCA